MDGCLVSLSICHFILKCNDQRHSKLNTDHIIIQLVIICILKWCFFFMNKNSKVFINFAALYKQVEFELFLFKCSIIYWGKFVAQFVGSSHNSWTSKFFDRISSFIINKLQTADVYETQWPLINKLLSIETPILTNICRPNVLHPWIYCSEWIIKWNRLFDLSFTQQIRWCKAIFNL